MKSALYVIMVTFGFLSACHSKREPSKETKELEQRFSGYVNAIQKLNIDSIQAYTYPKLFSIIRPEESKESMFGSFLLLNNKNIILDSVKADPILPFFTVDKNNYARLFYSVVIKIPSDSAVVPGNLAPVSLIHSIGTNTYPSPQSTLWATLLSGQLGMDIVEQKVTDSMTIMRARIMAIGVKEKNAGQWSFITVTNNQELLNTLFPKKVLEQLASKNQD